MKGSDRNKPCFCGSGLKYKNCHLVKEWLDKVDPVEPIGKPLKRIKVAAWGNSSGAFYWRLVDPLSHLNPDKFEVVLPKEGINGKWAEWADVYVLQGCVDMDGIALLHAHQQENGKKIVVDMDDDIVVEKDNPHKIDHDKSNAPEIIRVTMGIADCVTTTTSYLATKLEKHNKNIKILPNFMNMARWDLPNKKNTSDTIRIGWAGSMTHLEDIKLIAEPLKRIAEEFPKVQFVFVGDLRVKEALPGLPVECMLGVEFDAWPTMLHGLRLDIGLAPLRDTEFNRCKSNIKWQEYSIAHIPAVFSRTVYWQKNFEDKLGFIADTPEQWYYCIRNLIVAKQLREDIADSAYTFVKTHYDLRKHATEWENVYSSLIDSN